MAQTPEQAAAADDAWSKQYDEAQAKKVQQDTAEKQPPSFLSQFADHPGNVTTQNIDHAVHTADTWGAAAEHVARDVGAGAITAGVNIADSAYSFARSAIATDTQSEEDRILGKPVQVPPSSPVWEHAKKSILDFRDAVAVQDPNLVDNLTQGVAQLALPFAGFSRALAGMHGVANMFAAGAITDMTALQPHDLRTADLLALGRQTEGKLGDVLRKISPYGLNAYINFLTDRTNESEAEGRFKNALDGLGANLVLTPLLHAAGVVLKQGSFALRTAIKNGVNTFGDMGPPAGSPGAQRGAIGDDLRSPPAGITQRYAQQIEANASGESAASLEAQNWVAAQKASGIKRYRLDPDGKPMLMPGIEGRDPRPMTGHPVVDIDTAGNHELIDRGNMTKMQAEGLIARSKALHGLGPQQEK